MPVLIRKLDQDQKFRCLLAPEGGDGWRVFTQHGFNIHRGTVAEPYPHHAGRRIGNLAALLEI